MTMTGSNVDIAVRTQVDYYGTGRYDLASQLVTPDYVDHEAPPGTPPGPDGANAVLRWLRSAFGDLSYEIHDAFGAGDRVAVRLTTKGTHTGEFMGKAATGRPFQIEAIQSTGSKTARSPNTGPNAMTSRLAASSACSSADPGAYAPSADDAATP